MMMMMVVVMMTQVQDGLVRDPTPLPQSQLHLLILIIKSREWCAPDLYHDHARPNQDPIMKSIIGNLSVPPPKNSTMTRQGKRRNNTVAPTNPYPLPRQARITARYTPLLAPVTAAAFLLKELAFRTKRRTRFSLLTQASRSTMFKTWKKENTWMLMFQLITQVHATAPRLMNTLKLSPQVSLSHSQCALQLQPTMQAHTALRPMTPLLEMAVGLATQVVSAAVSWTRVLQATA
mmetsp:Transcript_24248/g.46465  ORF Transcript_24248/g.46465 Transcript_24248/m.46465 type:complete len:234 (-) Transcript_24248:378-1079(-)